MQNILFIVNRAPYGSEDLFNALRLTIELLEEHATETQVKMFLMSDAVLGGLAGQNPGEGYNIQSLIEIATGLGAVVKLCKTCTNARGLSALPLIQEVELGTMPELANWTLEADKVLTF